MSRHQAALLLFILIASFFLRDLYLWLFDQTQTWYRPYLFWLVLIGISVGFRQHGNND